MSPPLFLPSTFELFVGTGHFWQRIGHFGLKTVYIGMEANIRRIRDENGQTGAFNSRSFRLLQTIWHFWAMGRNRQILFGQPAAAYLRVLIRGGLASKQEHGPD
jgi:hypothetical protein